MAKYRRQNLRAYVDITSEQRLNNQIVLSGNNESLVLDKGAFFLELLIVESGTTVTIKDGAGNIIGTGFESFSQDHSPLLCEYGIEIVGDVVIAKGFTIDGVHTT